MEGHFEFIRPELENIKLFQGEDNVHAEAAEADLRRQVAEQPDLARYVNDTTIRNASAVYKNIPRFLAENPDFVQQLIKAHKADPDNVTMLVIPGKPLVLAHTSYGIFAMAPVLGCTYHALDELEGEFARTKYKIISSSVPEDELIKTVWDFASANPKKILSFRGSTIDPRDYIAIGASGMFRNEVFRMGISSEGIGVK